MYRCKSRSSSIQLASEDSRSLHEFLVLLLLHLELSLSLDADGVHVTATSLGLVELELAESQSFEKASRLRVLHDPGAMGHDSDLAVGIGGLLDGEEGLVDAVLRNVFGSLNLGHGTVGLSSRLRLRQRRRSEGQKFARHGVDLKVHAGLATVGILDIDLVHRLLALLLSTDCHLSHGSVELVDGIGESSHGVRNLVGPGSLSKNGRKVLISHSPWHRLGD